MKYKSFLQYSILILGICISAILVIAFPKFYHYSDIMAFMRWAAFWNNGWENIYKTCAECNYPILGMFSSAGLLNLLEGEGFQNAIWAFRIILAIIDGMNVIMIFLLMREFSIKNAALWAGITGLLLSSWAGGALWGQIDNISQLFLLLNILWIVKCNLSRRINFIIYLVISSLLLAILLLMKQLIVFSFISLELLLMVNIFSHRKWTLAVAFMMLQSAFLVFFVFIWDHFIHLDKPYISHLQLIWGIRSSPGDMLSANGFNIWVILHRAMDSSSHIPFYFLSKYHFLKIFTPYNIGIILFVALVAVISISLLLSYRKHFEAGYIFLNKEELLNFILHLAIVNLGFNVLLPGTHERYLYHFYPFILLAGLGLMQYSKLFKKILLVVILIGSNLYGSFVLIILTQILEKNIAVFGYQAHRLLAVYHAILLCVLFVIVLKYQGFVKKIMNLLEGANAR